MNQLVLLAANIMFLVRCELLRRRLLRERLEVEIQFLRTVRA